MRGRSILVVDDHDGMLWSLSVMIEAMGIECVTAESAEKAIPILMQRDFDVVISDYYMDGMTGDAFLASVRKNKPHIPTILMSGRFVTESNHPMFKEHYALPKPVTKDDLQRAILAVLKPLKFAS